MAYNNYNNNQRGTQKRTDRNGNPTQLKTAYQKKDRKTGELVNAFKCYIEVGGKLVKIEVSHRDKEHKGEGDAMWVKATEYSKNGRNNSRY